MRPRGIVVISRMACAVALGLLTPSAAARVLIVEDTPIIQDEFVPAPFENVEIPVHFIKMMRPEDQYYFENVLPTADNIGTFYRVPVQREPQLARRRHASVLRCTVRLEAAHHPEPKG